MSPGSLLSPTFKTGVHACSHQGAQWRPCCGGEGPVGVFAGTASLPAGHLGRARLRGPLSALHREPQSHRRKKPGRTPRLCSRRHRPRMSGQNPASSLRPSGLTSPAGPLATCASPPPPMTGAATSSGPWHLPLPWNALAQAGTARPSFPELNARGLRATLWPRRAQSPAPPPPFSCRHRPAGSLRRRDPGSRASTWHRHAVAERASMSAFCMPDAAEGGVTER